MSIVNCECWIDPSFRRDSRYRPWIVLDRIDEGPDSRVLLGLARADVKGGAKTR